MTDIVDVAFLLFGQAMPGLGIDERVEVVSNLDHGEYGAALDTLLYAIEQDAIAVDAHLLARARAYVE